MAENIEIEIKFLVSKDDFYRALNYFILNMGNAKTQTNFYFDTPTFALMKRGCALRIREKSSILEATLKTPLAEGLLETSEIVSVREVEHLTRGNGWTTEGPVKDRLKELGVKDTQIGYLTSMITKRLQVPFQGGELFFDENHFHEVTDYEIEFESSNMEEAKQTMAEFFSNLCIEQVAPSEPKIKRALDYMKKNL